MAADRILSDLASIHVSVVEQHAFAVMQQPRLWLRETNEVISRALTVRTARFAFQQLTHGLNDFVSRALERPLLDDWKPSVMKPNEFNDSTALVCISRSHGGSCWQGCRTLAKAV